MKKTSILLIVIALFLVPQTRAGNLTIDGNLIVNSNLTAHSIAAAIQGYKYVAVAEGTNDTHRGNNLRAAYATGSSYDPSATNRVAVTVPPGTYALGAGGLVMNTSYVDLIGLVPAQMTTKEIFTDVAGRKHTKTVANVKCSVTINGTVTQTVDNVRIESVILSNVSSLAYYPTVFGTNTVLRHVVTSSMRGEHNYAGLFIDCVASGNSFDHKASGTFIDCVGNGSSSFGTLESSGAFIRCSANDTGFAGMGEASGTFIDCVGGTNSFGGGGGTASGTFRGCVGGVHSLGGGGGNGAASGVFIDCVGESESFGGCDDPEADTCTATGTFIDCVGGEHSFGGGERGELSSTAKLQHCKAGVGSFGSFDMASDDFNYNVGGANTFLMLPSLPTSTNGLPSGSVYNSSGTLKVMP